MPAKEKAGLRHNRDGDYHQGQKHREHRSDRGRRMRLSVEEVTERVKLALTMRDEGRRLVAEHPAVASPNRVRTYKGGEIRNRI